MEAAAVCRGQYARGVRRSIGLIRINSVGQKRLKAAGVLEKV